MTHPLSLNEFRAIAAGDSGPKDGALTAILKGRKTAQRKGHAPMTKRTEPERKIPKVPPKKLGALLKLIGTTVILFSFATQNFLYAKWNSRSAELDLAMHDRSLIDKGAQLNEVLYFLARSAAADPRASRPEEIAESKLNQAARKTAASEIIALMVIDSIPEEKRAQLAQELLQKARAVRDYGDMASLFNLVNEQYAEYPKELNAEYNQVKAKEDDARKVYLGLYVFGTLILLSGLFFEWKSV